MRISGTHHVALKTPNFERLREFYVQVIGLPQVGAFPGQRIIFLEAGPTTIELIEAAGTSPGADGAWAHFAFEVEDVDAAYRELSDKDVAFHVEPKDIYGARIAFFKDPDGNELELFQPFAARYPSAD